MTNIAKDSVLNAGKLKEFNPQNIQIGDHRLAYEIYNGIENPERTAIICHGATATLHATKVLAGKLAEQRPNDRIILVNVPWHGESTSVAPIDQANVNTYAAILEEFIELLRENNTIQGKLAWFGWSMGGSIGMLLDLNGVKIDELILINSSPVWKTIEGMVTQVPAMLDPNIPKDIFVQSTANDLALNTSVREREDLLAHVDVILADPDVSVNDFKAILPEHYDIRNRLGDIKAKTLVYGNTQDMVATVSMQEFMDECISNSVMHISGDNHVALMKQAESEVIVSCFLEAFVYSEESAIGLSDTFSEKYNIEKEVIQRVKIIAQLTTLRKEAGLTQSELADATGLTQAQISKLEKGENQPNLDTLLKLANFYHKELKLV